MMLRIIYVADKLMSHYEQKMKGFSLLEMLLVITILSTLVILMLNYTTQKSDEMRRDKTAMQMMQVLNAAMSFYVNKSYWPLAGATSPNPTTPMCGTTTWTDLSNLQTAPNNFLPATLVNNPYNNFYRINCSSDQNGGGFYLYTTVNTVANAQIIAGRLPMAFITDSAGYAVNPPVQSSACQGASPSSTCNVVVTNVSIPGQNLNNARSVNFAGVYYSGSCVPAPNCPPGMSPSIIVAPSSVTGVSDTTTCSGMPPVCTPSVFPLSSFTAFARGNDNTGAPADPNNQPPLDCAVSVTPTQEQCWATAGGATTFPANAGVKYWRVCLTVSTQNGLVYPASSTYPTYDQQGKILGTIIAITRCVPNKGLESPSGSMDVWQPNTGFKP
jgi:prepilin-type N-terminal cleavage/methylation domain-containing protein